jgi:histidinol-phosphate phosphatase family protein
VLVTNQSGIGRGYFDETMLERIHEKLRKDLEAEGARLNAIYFCPHLPEGGCGCRKPATGMLERAVRELGIDLRSSYVVGDSENDVAMGRMAGCRTVQVTGDRDFNSAVREILGE